ncbi:MAG: nucleotidyltransferase family protein [Myxococcota bacterium]|nr:nucleotidyltransferase family protein [Myxococcota bacterium]
MRDPGEAGDSGSNSHSEISALILAAGASQRMPGENKLLLEVRKKPMVEHVVEAVLGAGLKRVGVVTGYQADRVGAALAAHPVSLVPNANHSEGMASSLRAGLDWLPPASDGVLICLGDMPGLRPAHIKALIRAFAQQTPPKICAAGHRGVRGNPVLWPRAYFEAIRALDGDRGARSLLTRYSDRVALIDVGSAAVLQDVDTPADLIRESERAG